MAGLVLVSQEVVASLEKEQIVRYQIANVAPSGNSGEDALILFKEGEIKTVRVSCSSTDFTFRLFKKSGLPVNTVDEIFFYEEANLSFDVAGLQIFYSNSDTPEELGRLYVTVENVDTVNATGIITLELVVSNLTSRDLDKY